MCVGLVGEDAGAKEALLEFDESEDLALGVGLAGGNDDEFVVVVIVAVGNGDAFALERFGWAEDTEEVGIDLFAVGGLGVGDVAVIYGVDVAVGGVTGAEWAVDDDVDGLAKIVCEIHGLIIACESSIVKRFVKKREVWYNRDMNILYCGDAGIKYGVAISILSLLMRGRDIYNIYIATIEYEGVKPFSKKTVEVLDKRAKSYNSANSVKLIDATEVFVRNLPAKNMGSYFTPCSMLRLYMDKFPELEGMDRVLYMDYDVVCRGSLSELYNMDLTGVEAAGVLDIYGKNFYHYRGIFNFDYMNSGVMLFNMTECRKNRVFEKAVALCAKRWMMLADQAALNKAIDKRRLVARRYNEQGERPRKDTVLHHFSNNFKFWPYFRIQKVKPHHIEAVHEVLGIDEYDDIYAEYEKIRDEL